MNKARQRIQKSSCVKPTLFANEDNLVEEIIPEEVLRFCGENILTFSCLETFPSIVKNYDITTLSQSNRAKLSNVSFIINYLNINNNFYFRIKHLHLIVVLKQIVML